MVAFFNPFLSIVFWSPDQANLMLSTGLMFVIFLSPWSTVNTPCNTSCGGGVMMKVRSCTNPRPQGKDGKICEGIDKQFFPCNTEPCDMQVGWKTNYTELTRHTFNLNVNEDKVT